MAFGMKTHSLFFFPPFFKSFSMFSRARRLGEHFSSERGLSEPEVGAEPGPAAKEGKRKGNFPKEGEKKQI